jgi:uncharacterized protein YbaP (TraB family)
MWVVRDADSTIYLFGTVHVLKPETQWRTPAVDAALKESSEVWLEVVDMDDPAEAQPLLMKYGVDRARPLSSLLTEAQRAQLAAAAAELGLQPQALEPMRPWLAALTLTLTHLQKEGFDPSKGVEQLLTAAAKAEGKPMKGLETLEQQLSFFAGLPEAVQVQLLGETIDDLPRGEALLDSMVEAWAVGDVPTLERVFVDELRDSPEFYDVLLVKRNEAWARQIQELLAGQGTSFIAVGAGHLVGPDSVQAKLAARGIKSERR